ncbi:DUF58 domain-containing protein [Nocardioides litoris]|uniref:DUF58 domain-containing protein n=1 Tax=Nocardioides litoris TaxID=1926648 RepID=UPI0011221D50|nr:DUF58 domain-containing protein [Nocardioides litoris]
MRRGWHSTTGRGRAVAVLGVALLGAGLAWHYPLVAALGACLVALVAAELAAVLLASTVEVEREVAPRVVVRQGRCEGRLRVLGRRRRGLVRLDVADRVQGRLVPVALPDDPGGAAEEASEVAYPVPTPRRGLVEVGPVQVRLVGLTGMAARSTESGRLDLVRVLPRRVPLAGMLPGHRRASAGGDEAQELGGTDLVGLHEYVVGDDLRRLHWATSARTGTLMVREDAEPSQAHVCVLLDDRASAYLGDADLFEEAVEVAAAIAHSCTDEGLPLRVHTVSDRREVVVPASVSRRPMQEHDDLEVLLTEVDLAASGRPGLLRSRDLDVAVAVTGPGADLRELALALGEASTRVVAVVDPAPLVGASQEAGLLVLRGATSVSLAGTWDAAVLR